MGEIADGIINGDFDSLTGEYLGEGYGYPRSRHEGGDGYVRPFRKGSSVGVKKYLKRFDLEPTFYHQHCLQFLVANQLECPEGCNSWVNISDIIQDNWQKFVQYTDNCHKRLAPPKNRTERRAHLQK